MGLGVLQSYIDDTVLNKLLPDFPARSDLPHVSCEISGRASLVSFL